MISLSPATLSKLKQPFTRFVNIENIFSKHGMTYDEKEVDHFVSLRVDSISMDQFDLQDTAMSYAILKQNIPLIKDLHDRGFKFDKVHNRMLTVTLSDGNFETARVLLDTMEPAQLKTFIREGLHDSCFYFSAPAPYLDFLLDYADKSKTLVLNDKDIAYIERYKQTRDEDRAVRPLDPEITKKIEAANKVESINDKPALKM